MMLNSQSGREMYLHVLVSCKVLIIRTLPCKQQDPEMSCTHFSGNTGNHHKRIKTCYKVYFVYKEEAHEFLEISKYFLDIEYEDGSSSSLFLIQTVAQVKSHLPEEMWEM